MGRKSSGKTQNQNAPGSASRGADARQPNAPKKGPSPLFLGAVLVAVLGVGVLAFWRPSTETRRGIIRRGRDVYSAGCIDARQPKRLRRRLPSRSLDRTSRPTCRRSRFSRLRAAAATEVVSAAFSSPPSIPRSPATCRASAAVSARAPGQSRLLRQGARRERRRRRVG